MTNIGWDKIFVSRSLFYLHVFVLSKFDAVWPFPPSFHSPLLLFMQFRLSPSCGLNIVCFLGALWLHP